MKNLLSIIIMLNLVSCGRNFEELILNKKSPNSSDPREFSTTDRTFYAYVNKFEDDYYSHVGSGIDVSSVSINFGNTKVQGENYVGVCFRWFWDGRAKWKEIIIDRDYWNSIDEASREILIKHELGHCVLNRDHDNGQYKGYPESVMNSTLINSSYFQTLEYGYNQELYKRKKNILKEDIDSL